MYLSLATNRTGVAMASSSMLALPHMRRLPTGVFYGCPMGERQASAVSLSHYASPGTQVAEHEHDGGHFILVTSGHYTTRARGEPGRDLPLFLYNPPGTVHRDRFEGEGSFFAISGPECDVEDDGRRPAEPQLLASRTAYSLARQLLGELSRLGPESTLVAEGLYLELQGQMVAPQPRRHRDSAAPAWAEEAWARLRESSADPVTIADIAAAVGVHPVHLARTFREHYRASPGELLRDWRVRNAARLLRSSKLPICEVALASGFADQSHFSRVFRRHFGVTPARFRDN